MVDTEEINLKTINILYGQTCFKQTCQNSNKTNDFLTSDKNNIYRLFLLQTKNNMKQNIGILQKKIFVKEIMPTQWFLYVTCGHLYSMYGTTTEIEIHFL